MKMSNIQLPAHVVYTLYHLKEHGFEAYVVGGYIRDNLIRQSKTQLANANLDTTTKDVDITTSATTEDVVRLFKNVRRIDSKGRTVLVVFGDAHTLEVSTFQGENIKEDLGNRDFTINSFAMDIDKNITYSSKSCIKDLYHGYIDVNNDDVFDKDPLRMMRAVRFSHFMDFVIEPYVVDAIKNKAAKIKEVAPERIKAELCKALIFPKIGSTSGYFRELNELGLLEHILPELHRCVGFSQHNPNHDKCVFEHSLDVVDYMPNYLSGKLAALLHDVGKAVTFTQEENGVGHFYGHDVAGAQITAQIMTRFKFSDALISRVVKLVGHHHQGDWQQGNNSLARFISSVGQENLSLLFQLKMADAKAKSKESKEERLHEVRKLAMMVNTFMEKEIPLKVTGLAVNGKDVIDCGFEVGPKIGSVLRELLSAVIAGTVANNRDALLLLICELKLKDTASLNTILGGRGVGQLN